MSGGDGRRRRIGRWRCKPSHTGRLGDMPTCARLLRRRCSSGGARVVSVSVAVFSDVLGIASRVEKEHPYRGPVRRTPQMNRRADDEHDELTDIWTQIKSSRYGEV